MEQTQVLDCLSALANETRLQIVRLLVRTGSDGAPAGDIAQKVQSSASRLSFHLNALEQAGLIIPKRRGRQIYYSANRTMIGGTIGYLLSDCCADDPQVKSCCMQHRDRQVG